MPCLRWCVSWASPPLGSVAPQPRKPSRFARKQRRAFPGSAGHCKLSWRTAMAMLKSLGHPRLQGSRSLVLLLLFLASCNNEPPTEVAGSLSDAGSMHLSQTRHPTHASRACTPSHLGRLPSYAHGRDHIVRFGKHGSLNVPAERPVANNRHLVLGSMSRSCGKPGRDNRTQTLRGILTASPCNNVRIHAGPPPQRLGQFQPPRETQNTARRFDTEV